MADLATPLSIWLQIAQFFLCLSGFFSDLLIIRLSLMCGFFFLFLNGVLGGPLWPDLQSSSKDVSLDSMIWATFNLYVSISGLTRLILDELPVRGLPDEMEALWRMFYRTGGLSKKLFATIIAPRVQVVKFQEGEVLPTEDYFFILYKGAVRMEVLEERQEGKETVMKTIANYRQTSGEIFDFVHLGLFYDDKRFQKQKIVVTCLDDRVTLFRFTLSSIKTIANERYAKPIWQSLLIEKLGRIAIRNGYAGLIDESRVLKNGLDPVFAPLEKWEEPKSTLAGSGEALMKPFLHVLKSIKRSFDFPWPIGGHPTGLRHAGLPAPPKVHSNFPVEAGNVSPSSA